MGIINWLSHKEAQRGTRGTKIKRKPLVPFVLFCG
jgi:hypothetical protein